MIEIGDSWTFVPAGFTQAQSEEMQIRFDIPVAVTGTVEYINREHGWFRVRYTCHGITQHECFPLPYEKQKQEVKT